MARRAYPTAGFRRYSVEATTHEQGVVHRMKLTRTRLAVIGVAASLATVVAASPASALFSGGATASCGYGQSCSGAAQDVPDVGSAGSSVEVNCNATTP